MSSKLVKLVRSQSEEISHLKADIEKLRVKYEDCIVEQEAAENIISKLSKDISFAKKEKEYVQSKLQQLHDEVEKLCHDGTSFLVRMKMAVFTSKLKMAESGAENELTPEQIEELIIEGIAKGKKTDVETVIEGTEDDKPKIETKRDD